MFRKRANHGSGSGIAMMEDSGQLFTGILVTVLGLIGLVLASGALDIEMYIFGFSLAGFGFLFDLMLVKRHYDRIDARRAAARAGVHHG